MKPEATALLNALAAAGQAELVERLEALRPTDPVQAAIANALLSSLAAGDVALLGHQLLAVLDGKADLVDLGSLPLRDAAVLLATLQRQELERRNELRDFVTRLMGIMVPVARGVLRVVLG